MSLLRPPTFLFSIGISALLAQSAAPPADFAAKAEAHAQAYVKQSRLQGSVLVAKDGKILLSKGYGMADEENEVPNAANTKFRIGSITKQFTAVAILQLQEQGKLKVSDPISKYVPNSPDTWKDITIHHLLTHTSGIHSYTATPEYMKHMRESAKPLEFIARFKDLPLDFAPGTKWDYSNSGYFLLGVIIEQVTGKSYEQYLRENILEKADMQDSGYDWDHTILKHRARGYERGPDGKKRNAAFLDMGQPYAAGSMYSTVEDLYRWDRALKSAKVVSQKSLDTAWTPVMNNYGYGWSMGKIGSAGHRTITHGGGINGFTTMMIRIPEVDGFVAVFSNLASPDSGKLANELARMLLGETVEGPIERKQVSVAPEILQRYAGAYKLGPMTLTVKAAGALLKVELTGQPEVEAYPESEAKMFLKVADAQLSFADIKDGKAQKVILHQGGRDQVATRITE